MVVYVIFTLTFFLVVGFFYIIMNWRWQKRKRDLEKIFESLDLPEIELEDLHRIPFH